MRVAVLVVAVLALVLWCGGSDVGGGAVGGGRGSDVVGGRGSDVGGGRGSDVGGGAGHARGGIGRGNAGLGVVARRR